jgi:uncharacterized SAM-binding protein YcdF (DUF218 family)
MFVVGKLMWAVVQPGNLLLVCLLAGILCGLARRGRAARWLIGIAAFGFALFAVAPIGSLLLLPLEERFPPPVSLPERLDGILVVGGGVDPGLSRAHGQVTLTSAGARVLAGIALARRHPEAKLVLLGGEGSLLPIGFAEARATLPLVLEEGIPASQIVLEERSRSTHENAVYAKELLQPRPGSHWVLVTSAYHMPRAVGVFRAAGWEAIPWPVDFRVDPRAGLYPDFDLLGGLTAGTLAGKEWLGLLGYRLMGWTRELFHAPARA